jgi:hypothetical protein
MREGEILELDLSSFKPSLIPFLLFSENKFIHI